jgi:hypothetical protein
VSKSGTRRVEADGELLEEYKKLEKSQVRLNEDLTQYMRLRCGRGGMAFPRTSEEYRQTHIMVLRYIHKVLSDLLHLKRFEVSLLNGPFCVASANHRSSTLTGLRSRTSRRKRMRRRIRIMMIMSLGSTVRSRRSG